MYAGEVSSLWRGSVRTMGMAIGKVHWGKPIWVTEGGAELPVTNSAVATALALAGAGRFSLDCALGVRLPRAVAFLAAAAVALGLGIGLTGQPSRPEVAVEAESELRGGESRETPAAVGRGARE